MFVVFVVPAVPTFAATPDKFHPFKSAGILINTSPAPSPTITSVASSNIRTDITLSTLSQTGKPADKERKYPLVPAASHEGTPPDTVNKLPVPPMSTFEKF